MRVPYLLNHEANRAESWSAEQVVLYCDGSHTKPIDYHTMWNDTPWGNFLMQNPQIFHPFQDRRYPTIGCGGYPSLARGYPISGWGVPHPWPMCPQPGLGYPPGKGPGTSHWGTPQEGHRNSGSIMGWRWGIPLGGGQSENVTCRTTYAGGKNWTERDRYARPWGPPPLDPFNEFTCWL